MIEIVYQSNMALGLTKCLTCSCQWEEHPFKQTMDNSEAVLLVEV